MTLHERKRNPWGIILLLIIVGVVILFAFCDFVPKPQTIEKKIVHTVD